jgi:signal transduction histidine kinase
MRSLQRQLDLGLGLILAAGFAIQWALGDKLIQHMAEQQILTRMEHDIDAIRPTLMLDSQGGISLEMNHQPPMYSRPYSGHYFVITMGAQQLGSPSLGGWKLPTLPLTVSEVQRDYLAGPDHQPLLVLTKGITVEGHEVTIAVGEDLTALQNNIRDMGSIFLVLNGIVIPLALMGQWFFVRRALKPFMLLRRELSTLVQGTAMNAKGSLPVMDEIHRLLQLVDRRLDRSRNALSNLAHGLKTPLAVLYQLADCPEMRACPRIQETLKTHSNTIYQLVERELKRARVAGAGRADKGFNPGEDLKSLIDVLRAIRPDKQLDFQIESPDCILFFDRQDILELLGNLLDNASKWANHTVTLKIRDRDGLRIEVEDDGAGCSDAELKRLGKRGVRLDESKEGHGLGLSIVRDIVTLYNGRLDFKRSRNLGGLAVIVRFPPFSLGG